MDNPSRASKNKAGPESVATHEGPAVSERINDFPAERGTGREFREASGLLEKWSPLRRGGRPSRKQFARRFKRPIDRRHLGRSYP